MTLEVTEVRLKPVNGENELLLAFASVVLNHEFVVHDIRLIDREDKVIAAMPNEEYRNNYRDIAHPSTTACRERIKQVLVRAYNSHTETELTVSAKQKVSVDGKN